MYVKYTWNTTRTTYIARDMTQEKLQGKQEGLRDLCVRGNLWRNRNKKYHVDREITSASWKSKMETQEEMSIVPQVTSPKDTAVHTAVFSCHPWPRRQNHLWGQTRQKVSAHPGWAGGCIREHVSGLRKKPGQEDPPSCTNRPWTELVQWLIIY